MTWKHWLALATGFSLTLLTGCSLPVKMYRFVPGEGSGITITCPLAVGYFLYDVQRDCVYDYASQGFVRVP